MSAEAISFNEDVFTPELSLIDKGIEFVISDVDEIDIPEELGKVNISSDSIKDYLRNIGKTPLLTAEEEVELSKTIEAGLYAQYILENPVENTVYSLDDLQLVAELGEQAKAQMIEANLRLVVSLAKRYTGRGLEFLDIIQEGTFGLTRAVEKFDYSKGFKFSTYASTWIKQSIARALAEKSRTIKIPVHKVEELHKVTRERRNMSVDLGREPTDEEVATSLGITVEQLYELKMIEVRSRHPSLNYPIGDKDGDEIGNLLPSNDISTNPEHELEQKDLIERLQDAFTYLTEEEVLVIEMRFGFKDKMYMQDEIGAVIGKTRTSVSNILTRAIKKLQKDPSLVALFKEHFGD